MPFKGRLRLGYIISGIIVLLALIVSLRSRPIFRFILSRALEQRDFKVSRIETDIFREIKLRDIKYSSTVSADSVFIKYSIGSILRKNIKRVEVSGLSVTPESRGGEISFPFSVDSVLLHDGNIHLVPKDGAKPFVDSVEIKDLNVIIKKEFSTGRDGGSLLKLVIKSGEAGFLLNGREMEFKGMKGEVTLVDSTVTVDEFYTDLCGTRVELNGKGSGSSLSLSIRTGDLELDKIVQGLKGVIKLELSVNSSGKKVFAKGHAVLRGVEHEGNYLGDFTTDLALKDEELKFRNIRWSLRDMISVGSAVFGIRDTSYNVSLETRGIDFSKLTEGDLKSYLSGNIEVNGRGRFFNSTGNLSGSIRGVNLETIHFEVSGSPEVVEVSNFEARHNNGLVQMFGNVRSGNYDLTLSGRDIDLNSFVSGLFGEANFDFNISGKNREPEVRGSFYVKGFKSNKVSGDYVSGNVRILNLLKPEGEGDFDVVNMNVSGNKLKKLGAKIVAENGKTNFEVATEGVDAGLKLRGRGEGLDFACEDFAFYSPNLKVENAGDMKFSISAGTDAPPSLKVDKWGILINNSLLYIDGTVSKEETDLTFQGKSLELHKLSDSLFGSCDMRCKVKGNISNPHISFSSYITDFSYRTLLADEVTLAGTYKNDVFYIETGRFTRDGSDLITLNGELPLTRTFKLDKRPLKLKLKLSDVGNEFAFFYKDFLILENCHMNGEMEFSGTYKNPRVYGDFGFSANSMDLPGAGMSLSQPGLTVTFNGDRIIINSFQARTQSGGVNITGSIKMPDTVALKIESRNLEFESIEGLNAKVSTSLRLSGSFDKPKLSGEVNIKEAYIEALVKSSNSVNTGNTLDYDLVVDFPGKVWLKNLQLDPINWIDAELSGNVQVRKSDNDFFLAGEASVKEGVYYYIDRPFRISTGELKFTNSSDINPQINLLASTTVKYTYAKHDTATDNSGEDSVVTDTINIAVSGTLKEPRVDPSSSPPMPLQDIMTLLTLNMKASDMMNLQRYANTMGTKATSYYLFRKMGVFDNIRNLTGMDVVRFEPELVGEKSGRFNVGKYVAKDLYLDYNNDIFSLDKQEFRVEYTPWSVGAIVAQRKENTNSVGMKFVFRY